MWTKNKPVGIGTFVALVILDILVLVSFVRAQLVHGKEGLVALVAEVAPHLVVKRENVSLQLVGGLKRFRTLVAHVVVYAAMNALHVPCQSVLLDERG